MSTHRSVASAAALTLFHNRYAFVLFISVIFLADAPSV